MGSFSVCTLVQDFNSRFIVFINCSSGFLGKTKFPIHRFQEPSSLGGSYSSNKLFFRGTQHINPFIFLTVNNYTPGNVKSNLVVDLFLVSSFPYLVSTKHTSSPLSMSYLGLGISLSHTIRCHFGSGRFSKSNIIFYLIPQY